MIHLAQGRITAILAVRKGAVELAVTVEDQTASAIAYPDLVGEMAVGDKVLLNTTAIDLHLGTGGCHFVLARLSPPLMKCIAEAAGHIMKLRYTPLQHAITCVEEERSPHREAIERFSTLDGMPVLVGELHSQLLPAVLGRLMAFDFNPTPLPPSPKRRGGKTGNEGSSVSRQSSEEGSRQERGMRTTQASRVPRIVYIMPDTAALPIAFSRTVAFLKERGWIEAAITAGQAFGGDLEAINLYTALIAAKEVVGADMAIITQGPGNVGTGTRFGFGGMGVAEALHAAHILGGKPVAIPRISFADKRERHRGLSHHTRTVLGQATLVRVLLPMPQLGGEEQQLLEEQLEASGLGRCHEVQWVPVEGIKGLLEENREALQTMGRGLESDPEFFLAGAAAGISAAE